MKSLTRRKTIFLWLIAVTWVCGQKTPRPMWLTGDAFQRQLESEIGIAWSSEPLREKLNALSEYTQIAIWLDRRIDPSQQPDLSIAKTELSVCLEQIAERLKMGVGYVGPVVYVGPPSTAEKIGTVAELRRAEAAKLPAEARSRMTQQRAWSWDMLTTPRELLDELAREGKVSFTGADQIPHDLWAAADLPPLDFTDRLTLLVAGFDLTFEMDASAKKLRLVPLPQRPSLVRKYSVRGDVGQAISQLQSAVPLANIEREGARIVASGRWEEHQKIARVLQGEKPRAPAAAQAYTVYSMKGPALLGQVLKTLQTQEKLNISLDAKAQEKLRDLIKFDVKNVKLEDLLSAVLRDTGLKFQLNGKELKIYAE